jgi:hypothetical protein
VNHNNAEQLLNDKEAAVMDESVIRPVRWEPLRQQRGGVPPLAATVGLMTAARVLGINPDDADGLARRGEFPCSVIETGEGYRVPFAALLRALGSGPLRNPGQDAGQ